MKHLIYTSITLLFLVCSINKSISQSYSGFRTGSFAGIHGALFNPAFIADNRLKYDINLASFNLGVGNNFLTINNSALFNPNKFNEPDFQDKYITQNLDGKIKNAFINVDVLGPSFFTAISDRDAIGFYTRTRGMVNISGIDQNTAEIAYRDLRDEELLLPISGDQALINQNLWTEYAVPYARIVHNDGEHVIKVGATLKLLQGISSLYVSATDYTYTHKNRDTMINLVGNVSYGRSQNTFWQDGGPKFKFEQAGIGLDLGILYEFRPKHDEQTYELDGIKNIVPKYKDIYKLKLGFSITDIGTIRYRKSDRSRDYITNTSVMDLDLFKNLTSFEDLDTRIENVPGNAPNESNRNTFSMNLPLALNFLLDYNIGKGFYLNVNPIIALKTGKSDINKTNFFTNYALTPRWESRWFGVYVPIEYNTYTDFNTGISLRLGPVFVGSANILSNLSAGETNKFDIAGGVKIPIPYARPRDKDQDGVSDKLDLCLTLKGNWETKGCPDRDKDGILDDYDKCPDVPGIKAFSGCPDRDNDGIQDAEDLCPDAAGKIEFSGCPDRDNDGVADKDDRCPDIAGIKSFNGCPDSDKDGIADIDDNCPEIAGPLANIGCPYVDTDLDGVLDKDDRCPTVKGPIENYGCPYTDTDEDGILDKDDACPNIKGPNENKGCPYSDTDGDGIIDLEDKCPATPGPATNFGCPAIEEQVKEVLKTAFDNLEFETGKAIIRESSYISLNELANLLIKKPEYRLLIEGHTDNVGSRESNMTLSRNRANSVKAYLINQGVDELQLKTDYYGPDKPIDTNDTPEGRQRNRRVEFNVYFL